MNAPFHYTNRITPGDRFHLEEATVGEAITDYEIVAAMKKYGGGFAVALAEAFRHADDGNQLIIKLAFPDYWDRYAVIAQETRGAVGNAN